MIDPHGSVESKEFENNREYYSSRSKLFYERKTFWSYR